MCYSIFDYRGRIEEFTFRRKVFDGNPMPEKTLIKVGSKSLLFGENSYRGTIRKSIFDKNNK